jgi:hypothetical protein
MGCEEIATWEPRRSAIRDPGMTSMRCVVAKDPAPVKFHPRKSTRRAEKVPWTEK